MQTKQFEILQQTIRDRKTTKVLAPGGKIDEFPVESLAHGHRLLAECLETAGWAPFHYDRGIDGIAEPWRFYVLHSEVCRQLAGRLGDIIELKPTSKIPALLKGCCAAVFVTWIPQKNPKDSQIDSNKLAKINEEHLAAASSATQNLLLLAESLKWHSYWSSGGPLGDQATFELLGIDAGQKLLGIVFLNYFSEPGEKFEKIGGKLRNKRSVAAKWCLEIKSVD